MTASAGWYTLGKGLTRTRRVSPYRLQPGDPRSRSLPIFTGDPETFRDGGIELLEIPYEPLPPGPIGALIRVIDNDGFQINAPVDLDDLRLVMRSGLSPAPGNPQFHQQMVYAVCTWLYCRFQNALGRVVEWGFQPGDDGYAGLTIFPHDSTAGANAFYDVDSRALRFGYFKAPDQVYGRNIPRRLTFTCLSHDIVVHECTHALLDSLRHKFSVPSGIDVMAFHEGFSDLVAILTHFSHRGAVAAAIAKNGRNALVQRSVLSDLASQFGHTTGSNQALRSAIDADPANPTLYSADMEPHKLGSVLVSAVFEAFCVVWQRKTDPLFRIMGQPSSSPEMVPTLMQELLTDQATKLASQFLDICIRAIDYCPVTDIELGEYLRALITADKALVSEDPFGYRDALIDAFSRRKVYPPNVGSFSEDVLVWSSPETRIPTIPELSFAELRFDGDPGNLVCQQDLLRQAHALGALLSRPDLLSSFGLATSGDPRLEGDGVDPPVIESIRTCRRVGPNGNVQFDSVIEITQRRFCKDQGLEIYGGCTLLIDAWGDARYSISKNVLNEGRVSAQKKYLPGLRDKQLNEHSFRCTA